MGGVDSEVEDHSYKEDMIDVTLSTAYENTKVMIHERIRLCTDSHIRLYVLRYGGGR